MNRKSTHVYAVKKKRFISPVLKLVLAVISLAAIIAFSFYFVARSTFFHVRSIVVAPDSYQASAVMPYIFSELAGESFVRSFFDSDHIFFYPRFREFSSFMFADEVFRRVILKRNIISRRVTVTLEPFVSYAQYCARNLCYLVSDTGELFMKAADNPVSDLLLINDDAERLLTLNTQVIGRAEQWASLVYVVDALKVRGVQVASVRLLDGSLREWTVTTKFGSVLLFSFDAPVIDFDKILGELSIDVFSSSQYVDFRIPNKIFYQ